MVISGSLINVVGLWLLIVLNRVMFRFLYLKFLV